MKPRILLHVLAVCIIAISCVKDVDFDQAEEVYLENEFVTDLVYFNLTTSNFVDVDNDVVVNSTVTESTNLEFLDDQFIQENLVELAIEMEYQNTFQQSFTNRARFLNRANQEMYSFQFDVDGSADGSVVTTRFVDTLTQAELQQFKRSIKLEVSVDLTQDGQSIEGNLDFRSKAYYKMLFDQ